MVLDDWFIHADLDLREYQLGLVLSRRTKYIVMYVPNRLDCNSGLPPPARIIFVNLREDGCSRSDFLWLRRLDWSWCLWRRWWRLEQIQCILLPFSTLEGDLPSSRLDGVDRYTCWEVWRAADAGYPSPSWIRWSVRHSRHGCVPMVLLRSATDVVLLVVAIFAHLHNWSNVQHTHRCRRSASRWCSERWLLLARYQDDLDVAASEAFSGNTPVSPVVPRLIVMPNLELTCSCLASQFW